MITKKYYFKIKVSYSYKLFDGCDEIKTSNIYNIVSNSLIEAGNTAKYLNQEEYGNLFCYKCISITVIEKQNIYIL